MRFDNPDWYIRKREKRIASFHHSKRKAHLRKELLLENPLCDNCGRRLQGVDPNADNYACAVLAARKLSCRECVPIVQALAAVESESGVSA